MSRMKHNPKIPRSLDAALQNLGRGVDGNEKLAKQRQSAEHARKVRLARKALGGLDSLSDLQRNFVYQYAYDFNATKAFIRAGGAAASASSAAASMLKLPRVRKIIEEMQAERREKYRVDAERVEEEIAKMAYANLEDFCVKHPDGSLSFDLDNVTRDQLAGIKELQVETRTNPQTGEITRTATIKLGPKLNALDMLAKSKKIRMYETPSGGVNPDGSPILPPAITVNFVNKKEE